MAPEKSMDVKGSPELNLIGKAMACCHFVKRQPTTDKEGKEIIQLLGNHVDVEMYKASGWELKDNHGAKLRDPGLI